MSIVSGKRDRKEIYRMCLVQSVVITLLRLGIIKVQVHCGRKFMEGVSHRHPKEVKKEALKMLIVSIKAIRRFLNKGYRVH
jgi:hypothetical protein